MLCERHNIRLNHLTLEIKSTASASYAQLERHAAPCSMVFSKMLGWMDGLSLNPESPSRGCFIMRKHNTIACEHHTAYLSSQHEAQQKP